MNFYTLIMNCGKAKSQSEIKRLLHQTLSVTNENLFRLMLDKSIIYNIKGVPTYPETNPFKTIVTDDDLVQAVQGLLDADLRGDALKRAVEELHESSSDELAAVFCWILDRKNPAKVGKTLVNGVYPELIRVQEYMGAVPGTDEALAKLPWDTGVSVQKKEDGMACLVHYERGYPKELRTRQGQDITKYFPAFFSTLRSMPMSFSSTVHHELFVYDTEAEELLDRKTGNGVISKQVKNAKIGGSVDESIRSVILDIYGESCQIDRYYIMNCLTSSVSSKVEQTVVHSLVDARIIALNYIMKGYEGVICKDPTKPFKQGKPVFNVKMKNEFEVDLLCIDWTPSKKNPEWIGSLLCVTSDGILEVNVGSGLTDFQRALAPVIFIGEILVVKAESIIKSKDKKKCPSLYLPRFVEISGSKTVADTYPQIKAQEQMSRGLLTGKE